MKKELVFATLIITLASGSAASQVFAESSISAQTNGKILLQVESKGEAWYVDPSSGERSYLGKPTDAFGVMKKMGIGITNENLAKIQVADKNLDSGTDTDGDGLSDAIETALGTAVDNSNTDGDGYDDKTEVLNGYNPVIAGTSSIIDTTFAKKQAGKILLQVESNGEAWYVNPNDNKRYFLGRPADAFQVMRSLGLGISNDNLNKIKVKGENSNQGNATNQSQARERTASGTPPLGNKASTSPEMSAEMLAEMQSACEDKSVGDTCSVINDRGTMSGTCQSREDQLSCLFDRPDGNGQASGTPPIRQEEIDACADKSSGDTCSIADDRGTMSGTCETREDQLACVFARPEGGKQE